MFGRAVLAIMLFSIPKSFPGKSDLIKFGYQIVDDQLKFNLIPTEKKEKNVKLLLSSIFKKPKKDKVFKRKRLGDKIKPLKSSRRRKPVNLIE